MYKIRCIFIYFFAYYIDSLLLKLNRCTIYRYEFITVVVR